MRAIAFVVRSELFARGGCEGRKHESCRVWLKVRDFQEFTYIISAIAHYHDAPRLPFHVLRHVTPDQRFLAP